MVLLKTLRSNHFHTLLKHQNPSQYLNNPLRSPFTATDYIFSNPHKSSLFSLIFQRTLSLSAQFETELINSENSEQKNRKTKKPLHLLFKEAVGLSEKLESSESDSNSDSETVELKKKLRKLEEDVRRLKENKSEIEKMKKKPKKDYGDLNNESKPKSLYALFANNAGNMEKSADTKSLKVEEPMVFKELSPDMVLFVSHLYKQGYFNNANFLPRNKFDVTCFENSYGRDFIKFAAEKFGKNNQEIAKWLSGSDLKKVALFGCPSLARKNVFSAKRLRTFFGIQEDTVCSICVLRQSCKFPNQSVWKGDTKNLNLAVVMRIIILYALESVPPQLVVPDEIKTSVSHLLKEVLNLSQAAP
ncbi:hypothetical protein F0562_009024 [Nyssa sinensis]|uniref:Uncharacterized protein n=1 Tax=Nyssa sinensis TaxID=561372 RepID=A0A5J5ABB4_9ASTE|nr:hypothetical protein F0562_009024 [Nyssa sinensis]